MPSSDSKTNLGKRREVLRVLVFVRPVELRDKVGRRFARVDEIHDGRTVAVDALRFKLKGNRESSLGSRPDSRSKAHLIMANGRFDPLSRLGISRDEPSPNVRLEPSREVNHERFTAHPQKSQPNRENTKEPTQRLTRGRKRCASSGG